MIQSPGNPLNRIGDDYQLYCLLDDEFDVTDMQYVPPSFHIYIPSALSNQMSLETTLCIRLALTGTSYSSVDADFCVITSMVLRAIALELAGEIELNPSTTIGVGLSSNGQVDEPRGYAVPPK